MEIRIVVFAADWMVQCEPNTGALGCILDALVGKGELLVLLQLVGLVPPIVVARKILWRMVKVGISDVLLF